jgi:hypothetical protein
MAKRVVDTLHRARAAVPLLTQPMLPGREEVSINGIPIGVDQATPISRGNYPPELPQALLATSTNHKSQNLAAISRNGRPEPKIPFFADAKFVDLYRIEGKLFQSSGRLICFF